MSGTRCDTRLTAFGGFLWLSLLIAAIAAEECDKSKCKGPLKQYEMMKCQPIYNKPDDCCAVAYNCSELFGNPMDECYAKGRAYRLGEALRNEDREDPCSEACVCGRDDNPKGGKKFNCRRPECYGGEIPGCTEVPDMTACCGKRYVCPENPGRLRCMEDGQIYQDGERFEKIAESGVKLSCQCVQGFRGAKGKSICWVPVHLSTCALMLESTKENPVQYKCPENDKATIIHSKDKTHESEHTCKYGNLTLHIGDELNEGKDGNGKCSCEVPPFVTCQ